MLMMFPLPRASMWRPTSVQAKKTLRRSVPMTSSQSAAVNSSAGFNVVMPWEFTRMSMRPCALIVLATSARSSASSHASARSPCTSPSGFNSPRARSSFAALRAATITRAPDGAKPAAIALPMPLVPPITSAFCPARLNGFAGMALLQQLRGDEPGHDQRDLGPDDDGGEHEQHRHQHDHRVLQREADRNLGDRAADHQAQPVGRGHQAEGERDDADDGEVDRMHADRRRERLQG